MSKLQEVMRKHNRLATTLVFVSFVYMRCFTFPIYNLSREWSAFIMISKLAITIVAHAYLGIAEAGLYPNSRILHIVPLNFALVLAGMGCRYLLEFGETSNTYNFTIPNIVLHIMATVTVSTLSWFWVTIREEKKSI